MIVHSLTASDDNKYWARDDHHNVDFMIAMYGYHLGMNFAIMLITYLAIDGFYKRKYARSNGDTDLLMNKTEDGVVYEPLNNLDEEL